MSIGFGGEATEVLEVVLGEVVVVGGGVVVVVVVVVVGGVDTP